MKYRIEDLYAGMSVKPEELNEIEHTWMLVELEGLTGEKGNLVCFGRDDNEEEDMNTKFRIARHLYMGADKQWGLYYYPADRKKIKNMLSIMSFPPTTSKVVMETSSGRVVLIRKPSV